MRRDALRGVGVWEDVAPRIVNVGMKAGASKKWIETKIRFLGETLERVWNRFINYCISRVWLVQKK